MAGLVTLNAVPVGSSALVTKISAAGMTRRRLLDLGLVPGTRVEAVRRSLLGDPVAYNIRGALVALRKEQSSQVVVSNGE